MQQISDALDEIPQVLLNIVAEYSREPVRKIYNNGLIGYQYNGNFYHESKHVLYRQNSNLDTALLDGISSFTLGMFENKCYIFVAVERFIKMYSMQMELHRSYFLLTNIITLYHTNNLLYVQSFGVGSGFRLDSLMLDAELELDTFASKENNNRFLIATGKFIVLKTSYMGRWCLLLYNVTMESSTHIDIPIEPKCAYWVGDEIIISDGEKQYALYNCSPLMLDGYDIFNLRIISRV